MKPAILGGQPTFDNTLPLARPHLGRQERILEDIASIFASGQLTDGSRVRDLEAIVSERLGVCCVAVSSCTTGLVLALKALGLEGEVILPSFTFFASAHALRWTGLKPVLADCDPDTFTLDPESAAALVTSRTCAVMAVNVFGNPPDLPALSRLARSRGIPLVVDAAQAMGSSCQGRPSGTWGDVEVFSMTPSKLVTGGEGGLVVTPDRPLAAKVRALRNYGNDGDYNPRWLGLNGRLSELHAAVAIESMAVLEEHVAERRRVASLYREGLSGIPGLSFQRIRDGDLSVYKDFAIRVDPDFGISRDVLSRALKLENIETRSYFHPPVHRQKLYADCEVRRPLLNTESLSQEVLCLPIFSAMSARDVEGVCGAIRKLRRHAGELAGPAADGVASTPLVRDASEAMKP